MALRQYNSYRESCDFVRTRFFSLPPHTFSAFAKFYSQKYGSSAESYLWKTYPYWKAGITWMSGQTESRVLACVPKFLSRADQITLLRFYLPWLQTLKEANLNLTPISAESLVQAYEETSQLVLEHKFKLGWFISEIFSNEEIIDFLDAFKFMLLKRLELSYQCVCRDIMRLSDLAKRMDIPMSVDYHVHYLGRPLYLPTPTLPNLDAFRTTLPAPKLFQTTDQSILSMLSEDALQMQKEQEDATVKAFISANDVKLALSHIQAYGSQEIDSRIEANGEGGRIVLHFVRRDIRRLRYEVTKWGWTLAIACVLVTALYFHGINHGYICLLLIPGGAFTFLLLLELWSRFQQSKKQLEDYERKKAIRFTKG